MTTMNVSLPSALKLFVDERVSGDGYGSISEYIRELIRRDRDRVHMRGMLLDGATSEPTDPVDGSYFDALRERLREGSAGA
jgi:antitoxin ParD1/3/4